MLIGVTEGDWAADNWGLLDRCRGQLRTCVRGHGGTGATGGL
jgi:hypothetical protein